MIILNNYIDNNYYKKINIYNYFNKLIINYFFKFNRNNKY